MQKKESSPRSSRRASLDVLKERRRKAIHMHRDGKEPSEIAPYVDTGVRTVKDWISIWERHDKKIDALMNIDPPGRSNGDGRCLNKKKEQDILKRLVFHHPNQNEQSQHLLWSVEAVSALIESHLERKLSHGTVVNYLNRWGLPPRKPAEQRSQSRYSHWFEDDFPKIVSKAKKGGVILWLYGTSQDRSELAYMEKNSPPLRLIYAVSTRGKSWFAISKKKSITDDLSNFLLGLIEVHNSKIISLLVDHKDFKDLDSIKDPAIRERMSFVKVYPKRKRQEKQRASRTQRLKEFRQASKRQARRRQARRRSAFSTGQLLAATKSKSMKACLWHKLKAPRLTSQKKSK